MPSISTTLPRIDPHSAALVVNSNVVALALAQDDRILSANAAFCRLFGRTYGLANVPIRELLIPAHRGRVDAILRGDGTSPTCVAEAFRDTMRFAVELHFEPTVSGAEPLLAIFARDVTDRFRAEAQLNLLAYTDPLTGLANRALFADRLRQSAMTARRTAQAFAVIMLDLDSFKPINDKYGHDAGDLVLQRIGSRLLATMRDTDTVARLGGDEFAVVIPSVKTCGDIASVAERLIALVKQPIDIGMTEVAVGASAGIAIYPAHATTVDRLLAAADAALYEAKRLERGCVASATTASAADIVPAALVWNVAHEIGVQEIDEQHARLVSLLNELAAALRNGKDHTIIFREVVQYADFHFATEERLMGTCRYDGTAAHQDMHRRLLDDINNLRLDEAEGISVSLTVRYLQEWLLRHVAGADRDLAQALLAAGVNL